MLDGPGEGDTACGVSQADDPDLSEGSAIEQRLALSYAPTAARAGLSTLLALDRRLAAIVRATREPMVGQMRLTWWHEALTVLGKGSPPAEPVLTDVAKILLPTGVRGEELATLIEGWEVLLDRQLSDDALEQFARCRGEKLFRLAGRVLGADDPGIGPAGRGWALADLAGHVSDPAIAMRARTLAQLRFEEAFRRRWSRAGRPLGALALLGRFDIGPNVTVPGSPVRVGRLFWHRMTGR